jgi:hypothetical protein
MPAPMAEVRFDKAEAEGYVLMELKYAPLVSSLGGSSTEANYGFVGKGPDAVIKGTSRETTETAVSEMVRGLQASSRMSYRLTLAEPGPGTEGGFAVVGFQKSAAALLKACEAPAP